MSSQEHAALRDEADPDPLVQDAADRLRHALTTLDARDEWGRALAWRQVVRIAIGPLLSQLRDAQTAARLLEATGGSEPGAIPPQTQQTVGSGWPGDSLFLAED